MSKSSSTKFKPLLKSLSFASATLGTKGIGRSNIQTYQSIYFTPKYATFNTIYNSVFDESEYLYPTSLPSLNFSKGLDNDQRLLAITQLLDHYIPVRDAPENQIALYSGVEALLNETHVLRRVGNISVAQQKNDHGIRLHLVESHDDIYLFARDGSVRLQTRRDQKNDFSFKANFPETHKTYMVSRFLKTITFKTTPSKQHLKRSLRLKKWE